MGSQQYEVRLHGPYRWYGKKDECLFKASEATKSGIYLWTIPFNRKYLTYYVGETGRSFKARFTEHTRDYLYGLYRVYDPIPFAQGRKKLVVKDDLIIKIYRRLAKKRYLRGKHAYEHERIYVPIPSRLHDIVRPFLNQRLKNTIHSELNARAHIF